MRLRRMRYTVAVVSIAALVAGACSSGTSSPTTTAAGGGGSSTTAGGKGSGKGSPGGGPGEIGPSQLTGELTSSLKGFTPTENGFGFQNYGKAEGITNMTAAEVKRFFGPSVCANGDNGDCILTPPAQQWMEATNDAMNGGHCEGMAVVALMLYKQAIERGVLGPDATNTFSAKLPGNVALQREIAYWYATQGLVPTAKEELKNLKPSELVDKLKESFADGATESYTIGIYKTVDGKLKEGHAMTPYGIVDKGDGTVEIAIYDNNFPGQPRALKLDTKTQKWSYSAAADPTQPESLYEGDGSSPSLTLTPTTPRQKPQACPFCTEAQAQAAGIRSTKGAIAQASESADSMLFIGEDAADAGVVMTVTDLDGNPLPGVVEIEQRNQADEDPIGTDAPPVIMIPSGTPFQVKIDATAVKSVVQTDITYVSAGYDNYIDGIKLDPGQVDIAQFKPTEGIVSYETKGQEAPTIGAGFSAPGADYDFAVAGVDLPNGGKITAALDQAKGTFTISNASSEKGTYAMSLSRIDDAGEIEFSNDGVELAAGDSIAFDYSAWDSNGENLKAIVTAGDGSTVEVNLSDE